VVVRKDDAGLVKSLAEAQQMCEQAIVRWFEQHIQVTCADATQTVFDAAIGRGVAMCYAQRLASEQCKSVMYPAAAATIASIAAHAIARTLS
jgi:hypothetical protein